MVIVITRNRMDWKDLVSECVQDLCAEQNRKDFTLTEVYNYANEMKAYYPDNNRIKDKIRQQLQYLRNDGVIKFTNIPGNYRLGDK